jgi:hypothetical protein
MAYIELGPVPCDEPCAQVGDDNYRRKSQIETDRYIKVLRALFKDELPEGTGFASKGFHHEFGTYREVCFFFDDNNPKHVEFAHEVERRLPRNWPPCNHAVIDVIARVVNLPAVCADCGADLNKMAYS